MKAEWLRSLADGLAQSRLIMPIPETDVRFAYYGQALYDLVGGREPVADVIIRGISTDNKQLQFLESIVEEIRTEMGITDSEVAATMAAAAVTEMGWRDVPVVRSTLRLIDQRVPGSGVIVPLLTNDVYQYLTNIGIRDPIEKGVEAAINPRVPTVVVGHSLGSVVAYAMLKRDGSAKGWDVPLFVTVGAPLALRAIRSRLAPIGFPGCVTAWFNARDERDVVALYPLDEKNFQTDPSIENYNDVRNREASHHGIDGYLGDAEVARTIYEALTA